MRTQFILSFILSLFTTFAINLPAHAEDAEPILINVSYAGNGHLAEDQTAAIEGVITSAKVKKTIWDWLLALFGLGDNLRANGFEIVATFPDESADVSSQLQFINSGKDKIVFRFTTPGLKQSDLNRFSVRVFDSKRDKQRLGRLLEIQTKVEQRLEMLKSLKEQHKKNLSLKVAVELISSYSHTLESVIKKIQDRIANDASLVADYTLPLQVGNTDAGIRRSGSKVGNFKLELVAEPGSLISGMSTNVKAILTRISGPSNSKYLPEIRLNGNIAFQTSPVALTATPLVYTFSAGPLVSGQNNAVEIKLHEWKESTKRVGEHLATLPLSITVAPDTSAPTWLATSTPSGNNKYLQNPEPLALTVVDSFGRINLDTLKVTLTRTLNDGTRTETELQGLGKADLGYGHSFLISGDGNHEHEGVYSLTATVKDKAGNAATPNPWSAVYRIDRTAPVISLGKNDNEEFDDPNYSLPIQITDQSPTHTHVYQNGVKIQTSYDSSFTVDTILVEGKNTFEIKSKDIAGNESAPKKLASIIHSPEPPQILSSIPASNDKIYVKSFPYQLPFRAILNRTAINVTANSHQMAVDGTSISGIIPITGAGQQTIQLMVQRFARGRVTPLQIPIEVVSDTTPPIIYSHTSVPPTNQLTFDLHVELVDSSPVFTEVWVNGDKTFGSGANTFVFNIDLPLEGENRVKISSVDAAGNKASDHEFSVVRDTTPPILTFLKPLAGSHVDGLSLQVEVSSNEDITAAKVNGSSASTLHVRQFQHTTVADKEGAYTIHVEATDVAGNTGNAAIEVLSLTNPLKPSLIGLYPDEKSDTVVAIGAVGATRPGLDVQVSSGFFNTKTVRADHRGAFEVALAPAVEYEVKVWDPVRSQNFTHTFVFGADSPDILAGSVRDSDNNPLVSATVSIVGTNLTTRTDANGVFKFSRSDYGNTRISGDQQIEVDGSTVDHSPDAVPRKFSKTTVAVTIGLRQSNILQTPIYLTPVLLDGSAQTVSANSGATVFNTHAPGVRLDIPANATQFPSGATDDLMSMATIPSEFSTVAPPPEARPTTVVALEPSGTTFSKPVDLVMPNSSEFPPGTEMVIMLMNSKTGKWEVGGAAVVSENGQEVRTKENQGIRHFSLAYATIAGPEIRQVGAQDRAGADTFNGAASTHINLPSFTVSGHPIEPTLYYQSGWAKPNLVVTNLFDFPNKKVDVTPATQYGAGVSKYNMELVNCTWSMIPGSAKCNKDVKTFYTNFQYETNYSNVTSEIQPQRVVASLKTGPIQTQEIEFKNLPRLANVSFATDLVENGNYFSSGIYPYQAHYNIHFKELILGTSQTKIWSDTMSAQIQSPNDFTEEYDGLFTQDLTESYFVQNYRSSPAGRGWMVGGLQKIANTGGNKILLEERDGSVSSYTLQNTIQTVLDGQAHGLDLSRGVALNSYPQVAVASATDDQIFEIMASPGSGTSKRSVGSPYQLNGTIAGYDFYNYRVQNCYEERYCAERHLTACTRWAYRTICNNVNRSYCSKHNYSFTYSPKPSQMILLNGQIYGVDTNRHAVFSLASGQSHRILGALENQLTFGNNYQTQSDTHRSKVQTYCGANPGLNCGAPSGGVTTPNNYNACGTYPASTGSKPVSGDVAAGGVQSLNAPQGITASPWPNILVIADTGNHKVRWINTANGSTGVIAGSGQAMDLGDGGAATEAAIRHPQGVAYDSVGNLYISSQSGYIRKVDTNGRISTLAGNPLNGDLSNEGEAANTRFNKPMGLVVDSGKGYLYVSDSGHNRVVRIDLRSLTASTVAGSGRPGFDGDGRPALEANISAPTYLGLDSSGNLLILDSGNNRLRLVTFQSSDQGELIYAPTANDGSILKRNPDRTWKRVFRTGTEVSFNAGGLQIGELSRNGQYANYEYNQDNQLTRISYNGQKNINYYYSGGRLTSIVDPAGRETTFSHNAYGDLSLVRFPDSSTKSFSYDADGRILSETDALGRRTKFHYNAQGRLASIESPDQATAEIADSTSQRLGHQASQSSFSPSSSGFGAGQTSDVFKDQNQNSTTVVKDFQGLIAAVQDPAGRVANIERDEKGRVVKATEADGTIIQNTYDNVSGDLIRVDNLTTGDFEIRTYNSKGQLVTLTDRRGPSLSREIDESTGLISKETHRNGQVVNYQYGERELLLRKTVSVSGSTREWSYTYDSFDNLASETDADGIVVRHEYDLAGNRVATTTYGKNGTPQITRFSYDPFNRLTSVTTPGGDTTSYTYNLKGKLTEAKDPKGSKTLYAYDNRDRITRKEDSAGHISQYAYDKVGNRISETHSSGVTRLNHFDSLNRLVQVNLPDDTYSYQYDISGKVAHAENSVSRVSYTYTNRGKIASTAFSGKGSKSDFPSYEIVNTYDDFGNRTRMGSNISNINFGYDGLDRITQVSGPNGMNFAYLYTPHGQIAGLARPGSTTAFHYTQGGLVSGIYHRASGNLIGMSEYSYDSQGFPVQKRGIASSFDYSYDAKAQLTGVTGSAAESYVYDDLGNRVGGSNGTSTYDSSGYKITSDSFYNYQFDLRGNLTAKIAKGAGRESYTYGYSSTNQLKEVKVFDAVLSTPKKVIYYHYDIFGRRIQKDVATDGISKSSKFAYDGPNVIAEFDESNSPLVRYVFNPLIEDDLLGFEVSGAGTARGLAPSPGLYFPLKDAQGTVTDITNANGQIIQKYDYSAYGVITGIWDANGNDISDFPASKVSYTFTGREWDEDAGLYYYRARYYDATTGRFLQRDPNPGQLSDAKSVVNPYIYVGNLPTVGTDPSGEFLFVPFLLAAGSFLGSMALTAATSALIGGAVAGTIGGLMNASTGGNFWSQFTAGFAANFGQGAVSGAIFGTAAFTGGALGAAIGFGPNAVQIGMGIVGAAYGGYQGRHHGLGGILIGANAGFIAGALGAGSGMAAWQSATTKYAAAAAIPTTPVPPSALPVHSPVQPVIPTMDDLAPLPPQLPIQLGPGLP